MATTLFCALVGVKAIFPVEIGDSTSVGAMKQAIKKEKASVIKCDADELQFYLAKKTGDTTWLKDDEEVAIQLESGVVSDSVKALVEEGAEELKATRGVRQCLSEKHMPTPTLSEIHIIVKLPPKPVAQRFPVEIESQAWAALATAIAKVKPDAIECDPDELQLYLAKRGGLRLNDDDKAAVDLNKGSTSRAIRVLVVAPTPASSLKRKREDDEEGEWGGKKAKSSHKNEESEEEEEEDDEEEFFCINEMRMYAKHPCICEQYRAATGRYR